MKHYLERLQEQMTANWSMPALCDWHGDTFTFGDLASEIERFHVLFELMGIRKGDRIAICARNQARWGVAFLAANTYEAIVVPILADFTPECIEKLIEHSGSVMLFTDKDILDRLDRANVPSVGMAINVSDFKPLWINEKDTAIFESVDNEFKARYPEGISPDDIKYPIDNGQDIAVINYTSGSTGDPKGVMLRYECFSANTTYGQNTEPSSDRDRILSILPMAHIFGMAFEMIYPLCGGTAIYFLGKAPAPSTLMKALAEVKPYLFLGVPMIYEKIYKGKIKPILDKPVMKVLTAIPGIRRIIYNKIRSSLDKTFGGNVRVYVMGGAAVNPELEEFFRKIHLHFTVGYGMTEAAPLIAYSRWETFKLHSCGRPMSFVQVRVDSCNPEKVVGEIQARGINLFSGYYRNDEATKAAFTEDGWFRTGDLGTIDKQGNIYLKGRCKNMLLSSNGQNVYPEEIEAVVCDQDYVKECVVVQRGEKFVALVYPDKDAISDNKLTEEDIEELIERIRLSVNARIPKYSQLAKVTFVDEPFEKTPKMSIKRYLYK